MNTQIKKIQEIIPKPNPPIDFARLITPEGKEIQLPIYRGTLGPDMIDIT